MNNIIEVKPDKDGKYFVTLYGHRIQLVPVKESKQKKDSKVDTTEQ